jgi:transposase-like protein
MTTKAHLRQQVERVWAASFQTNRLERFLREFRTKSDEIGAFPNAVSCLVVFHLIVIRDDAKHDRAHTAKTA